MAEMLTTLGRKLASGALTAGLLVLSFMGFQLGWAIGWLIVFLCVVVGVVGLILIWAGKFRDDGSGEDPHGEPQLYLALQPGKFEERPDRRVLTVKWSPTNYLSIHANDGWPPGTEKSERVVLRLENVGPGPARHIQLAWRVKAPKLTEATARELLGDCFGRLHSGWLRVFGDGKASSINVANYRVSEVKRIDEHGEAAVEMPLAIQNALSMWALLQAKRRNGQLPIPIGVDFREAVDALDKSTLSVDTRVTVKFDDERQRGRSREYTLRTNVMAPVSCLAPAPVEENGVKTMNFEPNGVAASLRFYLAEGRP